jgi:hypothetical protein
VIFIVICMFQISWICGFLQLICSDSQLDFVYLCDFGVNFMLVQFNYLFV